jgi:hypothetical protein
MFVCGVPVRGSGFGVPGSRFVARTWNSERGTLNPAPEPSTRTWNSELGTWKRFPFSLLTFWFAFKVRIQPRVRNPFI